MSMNCNIIRDLMPLYLDETLSNESRTAVEEHIEECPECRKMLEQMKCEELDEAADPGKDPADAASPLKAIKQKLRNRRIVVALITAVVVAGIAAAVFVMTCVRETYIPYEETGIAASQNGDVQVKENYYAYIGVWEGYDADGDYVQLFFLTNTVYEKHFGEKVSGTAFAFGGYNGEWTDDKGKVRQLPRVTAAYYLPQDFVERYDLCKDSSRHGDYDYSQYDTPQKISDIEKDSTLVWSAD